MKTLKKLILIFLLVGFIGCHEDNDSNRTEVENYIELLKSNKYMGTDIPLLSETDISTLLKYRNDRHVITNFPRNPLTSTVLSECEVGVFLLWSIESIRTISESHFLTGRFPSQNPILLLKHSENSGFIYTREAYEIISNAYWEWWENNKNKNFDEFKNIDPLENTEYCWQ